MPARARRDCLSAARRELSGPRRAKVCSVYFGRLTAAAMLLAPLANLTLLPAIPLKLKFFGPAGVREK